MAIAVKITFCELRWKCANRIIYSSSKKNMSNPNLKSDKESMSIDDKEFERLQNEEIEKAKEERED